MPYNFRIFQKKTENDFINKLTLGKELTRYPKYINNNIQKQLKKFKVEIKFVNWAEICNIRIKIGMVIAYGCEDDMQSFGVIKVIVVIPNQKLFGVCELLKTIVFDSHKQACLRGQ